MFPEVEALADACRFRDCTHDVEPGCAVLAAVEDGTLSERRMTSYRKLLREQEFQAARVDQRVAAQRAARWKQIRSASASGSGSRAGAAGPDPPDVGAPAPSDRCWHGGDVPAPRWPWRRQPDPLGEGVWRRAHDRSRRAVDRFHQVVEPVPAGRGARRASTRSRPELAAALDRVQRSCACRRRPAAPSAGLEVPPGRTGATPSCTGRSVALGGAGGAGLVVGGVGGRGRATPATAPRRWRRSSRPGRAVASRRRTCPDRTPAGGVSAAPRAHLPWADGSSGARPGGGPGRRTGQPHGRPDPGARQAGAAVGRRLPAVDFPLSSLVVRAGSRRVAVERGVPGRLHRPVPLGRPPLGPGQHPRLASA